MFKDATGKISSMRVALFVSILLSSLLVLTALFGLYYDKDINILLTTAISFMTISTAGKAVQTFNEKK